jgi:hypothetical protein
MMGHVLPSGLPQWQPKMRAQAAAQAGCGLAAQAAGHGLLQPRRVPGAAHPTRGQPTRPPAADREDNATAHRPPTRPAAGPGAHPSRTRPNTPGPSVRLHGQLLVRRAGGGASAALEPGDGAGLSVGGRGGGAPGVPHSGRSGARPGLSGPAGACGRLGHGLCGRLLGLGREGRSGAGRPGEIEGAPFRRRTDMSSRRILWLQLGGAGMWSWKAGL